MKGSLVLDIPKFKATVNGTDAELTAKEFALLLLLVTLSPLTPAINGAKRWIPLGFISIQPMEFVKIALALYLAYFMSSKQELIKTFSRGVIPPFAVTGLFCFLLLLQPDFGSAVVLASILFFMCVAGGTRFVYLFFSVALACGGAMALAISSPYRLRRLLAFLDPFQDAHNTGYQLVQSLLAIGSGSFFGVGVGASKQKMFYLPEAHNACRRNGFCGRKRSDDSVCPAFLALLQNHHGPAQSARPLYRLRHNHHSCNGFGHESGRGHGGCAAQGRAHAPHELRRQ